MKQRPNPLTRVRFVVVACTATLATLAVGCGDDGGTASTETTTTSAQTSTTSAVTTTQVEPISADASLVYFTRGEFLAVAGRDIPAGGDALLAALRAVVEGPSDFESDEAGLGTAVPDGSRVNAVDVEGPLATVDLSASFQTGGGSLSMLMRVAQIVYTATESPGIEQVTITIDGQTVDGLGGEGVDVDAVERSAFDSLLPPILVQRPVPGQAASHTLEVSGLANVFEGTVSMEVVDEDGEVVATGFGTGAMGDWAPFEATLTIPATVQGDVILRCFEESAKDGSHQKIIEVPLTLTA